MKLSAAEQKILQVLEKLGTATAAEIGMEVWSDPDGTGIVPDSKAAAWARPAGAVLKRLKHAGLVACQTTMRPVWRRQWRCTRQGERRLVP